MPGGEPSLVRTLVVRGLRRLNLTLARTGEVRKARWNEFDLDQAVRIAPAERVKARREHRVPLSTQAIATLEELHEDFEQGGERRRYVVDLRQ